MRKRGGPVRIKKGVVGRVKKGLARYSFPFLPEGPYKLPNIIEEKDFWFLVFFKKSLTHPPQPRDLIKCYAVQINDVVEQNRHNTLFLLLSEQL